MSPKTLNIYAKITKGIKYTPLLCRKLRTFTLDQIKKEWPQDATFLLKIDENTIATSWWVSPKRTRSYPYTRVYDSLAFSGKKATVIPIIKDEGFDGDRDFLQWDTVSLMSLLGVYVIISYYKSASKNMGYKNKITNQKYDIEHVVNEFKKLLSYQSDALHWNLLQLERSAKIAQKALNAYKEISKSLSVKMHSAETARERIKKLSLGKEQFLKLSRELARKAQKRESITQQPKEKVVKGEKATITIKNYLGGKYFFTVDETEIHGKEVFLIEGKHSATSDLPSESDIKDGLLKMILYTNLEDVEIESEKYNVIPLLKLTTKQELKSTSLKRKMEILHKLENEAKLNGFKVTVNGKELSDVIPSFSPAESVP